MKTASVAELVRASLQRDRRAAFFSAFGVAVGVGALVFFVSLGLGVRRVVREKIFPVDMSLVEVVPPAVSIGAIFGGGRIDQSVVDRLAALPGVRRTFRKVSVQTPASARYDGGFFGSRIRMGLEVVAVGVDPELMAGDVREPFEDTGDGQPIPAVVANRLLEIYNKSFAPSRKLPQLSSQMVTGFSFPVEFGRSFVAVTEGTYRDSAQLRVVGTSDRALLGGVTIPLATAMKLNERAGKSDGSFSAVVLEAESPDHVPALVEQVREMGLSIEETERRLSESVGAAVAITTTALALLSILICVLAAVNITHALSAAIRARAKEIGVMRAIGATRADVSRLVLSEALVLGLIGGTVGTVFALATALGLDALSARFLPEFPFKPESYFAFPAALWVGGVLLGAVAALTGAFFPSRAAAAVDPTRTLAG